MKNEVFGLSPVEAKYTVEQMHVMIVSYLVKKSGISEAGIKPQCSIQKDLSLDSLDKVELIMWCEAEFDICIPYGEAENLSTVEDLFRVVEKLGLWLKD